MKRVLTIATALVLCLGLCTTAFASGTPTFQQNLTRNTAHYHYDEKPEISVTEDAGNPESGKTISLSKDATGKVTIDFPTYASPGVYKYAITQVVGNTQGMVYDGGTIGFEVLVGYQNDTLQILSSGLSKQDGEKKASFDNQFQVGTLTVTNSIAGNIADKTTKFPITVTFHADKTVNGTIGYTANGGSEKTISGGWTGDKEITAELGSDGTLEFVDLPAGLSYTVSEASTDGYVAAFSKTEGTIEYATADGVTITNTRNASLDTGIRLDSLPYILILAAALTVLLFLFLRRRREEEEE